MAIYSGDIFAENYTVSSSVTNVQIAADSGSMKFGDSGDDTHQFTGSLFISGSRIDIDDGFDNVAIGRDAGAALTTGDQNLAIGKNAMKVHTTGGHNIAIGYGTMADTDAGSTSIATEHNMFIGVQSGAGTWADSLIRWNVGIGNYSMDAAMNGALNNVAVGYSAFGTSGEQDYNTAVGYNALTAMSGSAGEGKNTAIETLSASTT